jgi:hypothetical protein
VGEEEVAAAVTRGADALDEGEAAARGGGGSGGGGGGGHATHHPRAVAPHGSVDGGGDDEDGGVLTLSAACTLPPFESAVTALAFAPVSAVAMMEVSPSPSSPCSGAGGAAPESAPRAAAPPAASGAVATVWLAVGLESGAVSLWRVSGGVGHGGVRGWAWAAAPAGSVPPAVGHAGAVRKLAWRPPVAPPHLGSPRGGGGGGGGDHAHVDLLLASAGDDHTVRFTRVAL